MKITNFTSVDSSPKSTTAHKKRRSGRKKFQETRHPVFRGVRERKGKWVCEMREPHNKKSRLWLGTFPSPNMAARAYDLAAVALKGELASLNFPGGLDMVEAAGPGSEKAEGGERTRVEGSLGNENKNENVYFDEEEFFNMPGLIDGLAEGLMLTPPTMQRGFSWDSYNNYDNYDTNHGFDQNVCDDHEFTLWSD